MSSTMRLLKWNVSIPAITAPWALVLLGLVALYSQSIWDLSHGIWATSEQAHGAVMAGTETFHFSRRMVDDMEFRIRS